MTVKMVNVVISVIVLSSLSVWLLLGYAKKDQAESQTDSFSLDENVIPLEVDADMPAPGTYELYKISSIPQLTVLNSSGNPVPISQFTKGKITLLTFFYQRCTDADGCPYAMALFHRLRSNLVRDEALRNRVRFVHISFDPNRDTPQMMAGLEKQNERLYNGKKDLEWDFLTTGSIDELLPVIDAFGQNVDIDVSSLTNEKAVNYSHVLKMFLIDEEGYIREIYSTTYVSKNMLLTDIQTLALDKRN